MIRKLAFEYINNCVNCYLPIIAKCTHISHSKLRKLVFENFNVNHQIFSNNYLSHQIYSENFVFDSDFLIVLQALVTYHT